MKKKASANRKLGYYAVFAIADAFYDECKHLYSKLEHSKRCEKCKYKLAKDIIKGTPPDFK